MVVPTLGRRMKHLSLCLESIASQEADVDLVLVAPKSAEIEAVAVHHSGRLVPDPLRGISGALNAGFAAALEGTEYVAWLGDDDMLSPGSLAATTATLDAHPRASLVYGWCDYIDDDGTLIFTNRAGHMAGRTITFAPNLVPQPGSLMRLEDVQAVGGVDEQLSYSMDLDLFLRLRQRGRLVALPRVLASFRWHPDSTTVQAEEASAEEADRVRMRYMAPWAARVYGLARWPGRWALRLVKWRVRRRAALERQPLPVGQGDAGPTSGGPGGQN
ncbi:glycosyltransferase [Nocardioides sp.]|uniref:glycosyltransferase n=1 Tax=Nocardioides sp. TaxID=35761 RepID=UPI002F402605